MSSTNPFEGQHKPNLFELLMFVFFILPCIFVITVWERSGLSTLFEEKDPPVMVWDINIDHLAPSPWNDQLLDQLEGQWENNCVATVRATVDETWVSSSDTAGSIVKSFDAPDNRKQELEQKTPGEVTLQLYRIQGDVHVEDGPAPKYVMVQTYNGYTPMSNERKKIHDRLVVYAIVKNSPAHGWWFDQFNVDAFKNKPDYDCSCLHLDGQTALNVPTKQPVIVNTKDVAALMEIAEAAPPE